MKNQKLLIFHTELCSGVVYGTLANSTRRLGNICTRITENEPHQTREKK